MSVNAWGDSREKVNEWVDSLNLSHLILLDGKSIAHEKFFVTAYPTTFIINRDGVITNRATGFKEDDFELLKSTIEKLIGEK